MRKRPSDLLTDAGFYIGYAVILIVFLGPLFWTISLSLRPMEELFEFPPRLLPASPTLDAYRDVLANSQILTYLWNSLKFAFTTVVGALLIAIPSAYALSRLRFRGLLSRQTAMLAILAVQLISPLVTILPLYRLFSAVGLIDSQLAVMLVYVAIEAPFATWMLKGFLDTVPKSLDEAATMDGCTRLQTLRLILLPVMLPGLASTAILLAIATWGQFLIPYVLLDNSQLYPIGVGILDLQSTTDAVSTHKLAAAAILAILPALLIFAILQRFIVSALTAGAVKG